MQRTIIAAFLMWFVFLGCSAAVNAENNFTAPFTKPFSIFKDKEPEKTEESELNIQIEKNEKVDKNLVQLNVYDPKNSLGVTYVENILDKVEFYIEEEDFESAKQSIKQINEWVYDATEYHTDLFKTLKKLDNSEAQADIERKLAIQFAVLRDKTLFLEAQLLLNNGEKKQAVENLVEVVRSQPKTDLGFKAYETLQDIGFTYKIEYKMIDEQDKQ